MDLGQKTSVVPSLLYPEFTILSVFYTLDKFKCQF